MTTARTRPWTLAYGRLVIVLTILGLALPAAPGPSPTVRGAAVKAGRSPAGSLKAQRRLRPARGVAALALHQAARRSTADPSGPLRPAMPGPRAPDDSAEPDELPDAPDDPIEATTSRPTLSLRRIKPRSPRPNTARSDRPGRSTPGRTILRPPLDLPTRLCRLTC